MAAPGWGVRLVLAELRRRRVFRLAGLYVVVAWALLQVAVTVAPLIGLPEWAPKLVLLLLALGFPLALALSWIFAWTPEHGLRREGDGEPVESLAGEGARMVVATSAIPASPQHPRRGRVLRYSGVAALLGLLAFAAYARYGPGAKGPSVNGSPSVAVLAFSNLSRDPDNEYFSDGIADELLNQLTKVSGLQVAARTSSFYFKGRNLPVEEIARRLNVGAVVEGSVQRSGNRVRITAQLISARTGFHLWSDSYDRDTRDLFGVEDEIAQAIASALRVQLMGRTQRRHLPDPVAHDLYLRGRYLLNRGSRADLERSVALFRQATGRDSTFAEAYAAAATAWETLADAYVAPLDAYPRAEELAQRALAFDEANAEAHSALAFARMDLRWDWDGARREFERALELNPRDAETRGSYSEYLLYRGQLRQALAAERESVQLEPFAAYYAHQLVGDWWMLGEADSAIAAYKRAQEITPGYVYGGSLVSEAYRAQGRLGEALTVDRAEARAMGAPTAGLVESLVAAGKRAEAESAFGEMVAQSAREYVPPERLARAALALGQRDQALTWLERGVDLHSAYALSARTSPAFRDVVGDPRYRRLLLRMGLDSPSP